MYADVVNLPDAHVWARDDRETNGSRETLVTLRIIVLEADLEFDGLEEVTLLGLEGVGKEFLYVGTHSGCGEIISNCAQKEGIGCKVCDVPTVILDMMTVFQ